MIVAATLLAALPWGLPGASRFVLPLIPFAVIYHLVVQRPHLVPDWLVFLAGLLLDILTDGPFGYWPLMYLAGFGMAVAALPWARAGRLVQWLLFAVIVSLLAGVEFVLALIYFGATIDASALVRAAVSVVLVYPVIALSLGGWSRAGDRAQPDRGRRADPFRLERGA